MLSLYFCMYNKDVDVDYAAWSTVALLENQKTAAHTYRESEKRT